MSRRTELPWSTIISEVRHAVRSYSSSECAKPPYLIDVRDLARYIADHEDTYRVITSHQVNHIGVVSYRGVVGRCIEAVKRMGWKKWTQGRYVVPWNEKGELRMVVEG